MFRFASFLVALWLVLPSSLPAQLKVQPVAEHPDQVSLRLMLRKLKSVGTFMQTTAHPDDEDNGLLAMLGHGEGMRAVLVTATRGDGGQNEIGPELFQALGILRTEELLAGHRFDGAEQLFTRAIDFGYSFSVEESLQKWGHDEILGDFVRHIRTIRPDVIAGFLCGGAGGGQHHQATAQLTREAFRAAADPTQYRDQIALGLRPWQAKRVFCTDPGSFAAQPSKLPLSEVRVTVDAWEPLLGRTYTELGVEARSMQKCQGTSQLLPLPGASFARIYRLVDSASGSPGIAPARLFEGIDTTLSGLAAFAEPQPPVALVTALRRVDDLVLAAERSLDSVSSSAAAPLLASGLKAVRDLRRALGAMRLSDVAQYEIDFRLDLKERQFAQALITAYGTRMEALADDGLVTVGQPVRISILGRTSGSEDVIVRGVTLDGFEGTPAPCSTTIKPGGAFTCESTLRVAQVPFSSAYWRPRPDAARYDFDADVPFGVPFRPSPFRARVSMTIAGADIIVERPVEYRYDNIIAGEKRMELKVVPEFAVTLSPPIAVIPQSSIDGTNGSSAGAGGSGRRLDVTVISQNKAAASGNVRLQVADGWQVRPASAPLRFSKEDESVTASFVVTPPRGARQGTVVVKASIEGLVDGTPRTSELGYDVIEYPHVHRRHLVHPAEARLEVIDVSIAPDLRVGYIMGVGDQVPPAIEQLGAAVHLIGPDELAAGDLSRYDVILTGVRAYERRADLRANNHRLLQYAAAGGTVLVQYNKTEFNQAQYGPYPVKVGPDRVTDENAPVEILVPEHTVFTSPNHIGPETWTDWVQERGLYFLGERDPRYVDLVRLSDPFEYNRGAKTGALVEAKVGKGRWIYIGLGLWRQLPAGTPGAYQLLANLLSLGRTR